MQCRYWGEMLQENMEIVRALFEAFNERDVEAALDFLAPDGEWGPAFSGGGLIEGAVYRGHEGVRKSYEMQAEKWEAVTADLVEVEDFGDKVLVEVHLSAIERSSDVNPVDRTTWNVLEIRNGKVAFGLVYPSRRAALEAAGLSE
jgi:ketosteroid isomerase-like protein